MQRGIVTFLSDYGASDEFVGVCHGVICQLCPQVRILDVAHGIARHDVRAGALALRAALPFMPVGVHLAVVDPGVGAERRAIAVRVSEQDRLLVGPDNGVLALAAERLGGVLEAVDISRSPHRLEPVSATFHGRDIFAPVAAHLAGGSPLGEVGEPIAPEELIALELPRARVEGEALVVHALHTDRFGNVTLDFDHDLLLSAGFRLGRAVGVQVGGQAINARYARTFADVAEGELLLYEDAQRSLALAVNRGSVSRLLELRRDQEIRLTRR